MRHNSRIHSQLLRWASRYGGREDEVIEKGGLLEVVFSFPTPEEAGWANQNHPGRVAGVVVESCLLEDREGRASVGFTWRRRRG